MTMSAFRALKMLLTLHCDEASRIMSDGLDRSLTPLERWALRLHLVSCRACRRFRRQLAFLQRAARASAESVAIPDKTLQAIRTRIAQRISQIADDRP